MNMNFLARFFRSAVRLLIVCGALVVMSSTGAEADVFDTIREAMSTLKAETGKLGAPRAEAGVLSFGPTQINGNFEIVDAIKAKYNCTATLFVKEGNGFVRVSTNVMKDGKRAVGTPLDPKGPAIAAISKDQSYYGIADILGVQYSTGYEPMKNEAGETVGVYYVGFAVEAGTLEL
jgi:hypothetical protein